MSRGMVRVEVECDGCRRVESFIAAERDAAAAAAAAAGWLSNLARDQDLGQMTVARQSSWQSSMVWLSGSCLIRSRCVSGLLRRARRSTSAADAAVTTQSAEQVGPGVTDACRTWWECMTCRGLRERMSSDDREGYDERLYETGEAHGLDHQHIDGSWMTPSNDCLGSTLDHDGDDFVSRLPDGDHPCDLSCEDGYVYIVGLTFPPGLDHSS